jgi:Fic family protein
LPPVSSLRLLAAGRFETVEILKKLAIASRQLAELKGIAASIPNQGILISTLGLQEAKDSSAIENIVTTHDELFRDAAFPEDPGTAASKEVLRYREALFSGFNLVRENGFLSLNHILDIQAILEKKRPGFRKVPGTTLKDQNGRVVYTPPNPAEIMALLDDFERFVNDAASLPIDPLMKMAVLHHQFESIHPFYDGNGRTGRIVNVLYLVMTGLLDIPVLYLSRYIVRTKAEYYRLLQAVRDDDAWEDWMIYMLTGIAETAREGVTTVGAIRDALLDYKHRIRKDFKFYSQDLINNLFSHPYTKIQFVMDDLGVSRITATSYLNQLADAGLLERRKLGRQIFYINRVLFSILAPPLEISSVASSTAGIAEEAP